MLRRLVGVCVALVLASGRAFAADAGSLQVAVAAPDPAFAGASVSFQVLAVNTGSEPWVDGTYSWEAQIFDLEKKYVAKTAPVLPTGDVAPGGIASVVLSFAIPEGLVGRKYFRVFLTHEGRRLIESDYTPFSIVEKPFTPPPPPPEVVEVERPPEYRIGGNVSFLYKYVDGHNQGATTVNAVGKMGYSSYLFNSYFLHHTPPKNHLVDPYIIVLNYYAPWGVVNAGDISPSFSPLSLSGQGMRGAALEQKRDHKGWATRWDLLGGRVFPAASGSAGTDGRYERWLYGARFGADLPGRMSLGADYVLAQDNAASLSSDAANPRFRGPTLRPQRNPLYGVALAWEPMAGLKLSGDFQQSEVSTDSEAGISPLRDSAWRTELAYSRPSFSLKTGLQRTGPKFAAFGSPLAIADRLTSDASLNVFPAGWTTLYGSLVQFKDNLDHDPAKTTTQQRTWTAGDGLHLKSGTDLNLSYSLNTVQGAPVTVLDNRTGALLFSVTQSLGPQSLSGSLQQSQFRDKTKTSDDLDSRILGLRATGRLGQALTTSLGATVSGTKDKADGSQRKTQSLSGSLEFPLVRDRLTDQLWGTWSKSDSDSPLSPDDSKTMTVNTELVWRKRADLSYALGAGYNDTTHTVSKDLDKKEITASLRVNYAFEASSRPAEK